MEMVVMAVVLTAVVDEDGAVDRIRRRGMNQRKE